MSAILYYVTTIEIDCDDYYTGFRDIRVYTIVKNKPLLLIELRAKSDFSNDPFLSDEEEIQMWLDNNDMDGDYSFENLGDTEY